MKLRDIYATTRPAFSFEFFPPKTDRGEATLFETVERLKALSPAFFSMTYGAGGSTREKTVELGSRIRRSSGVETVCHVTCVGQSRDEVRGVIRQIAAHDMENVMALRGDPPRGQPDWRPHPEGFRYAVELVREVRAMGDYSVAVAGFPEMHPESKDRRTDLRHLKAKVEAGADAVITQLFFDNEDFFRFDRDLKAMGVAVPIVPGIMPIHSVEKIRQFCAFCKARIPEALDRELDRVADDAEATRRLGVEFAARQIEELLDSGAPGAHLYCLNRAESVEAIVKRLGRRQVSRRAAERRG
jgi:methylenetetrahydrofolate reductase (NADPH)